VVAECTREACCRLKAVALRDLEYAGLMQQRQRAGRALQPDSPDEVRQRLAGDRDEDPVEVERRKGCDRRQPLQRQFVGEVRLNVVDGAIDPPLIFAPVRSDPSAAF
jgi:hypothetical protein